jgi:SAM-dependent methyltransferase
MSIENSYLRQIDADTDMGRPSQYTNPGSIDNWRHNRMLAETAHLISVMPQSTWMTIGDGRYGSDAAYLAKQGVDALATNLTDERLRVAHQEGFIRKYQRENAEHISLADNSFDFVLCKESYHHFPRPPIALYEMLRVARVAVVLIEPLDNLKPLDVFKSFIKRVIRGDHEMNFEPSGNYIYKPSIAEIEKLLTAMGGEFVAVKGLNDFYHPKLSMCDASSINFGSVITKLGVLVQDVFSNIGLLGYGLGTIVVFKGAPPGAVLANLRANSYKVIALPKNPYLSAS